MSAHIDDRRHPRRAFISMQEVPGGSINYTWQMDGLSLAEVVLALESCKLRLLGVGGGVGAGQSVPGLNPKHA